MMKWEKKGKIFDHKSFDLWWFKKNAMVPLPFLRDEHTLRLFVTMCDEKNMGRIGYVDVDPENPTHIIDYSKTPLIDIGEDGHFDDNGVVTASLLWEDEKLYMFYSGYQSCVKVPYMIFSGLAVSYDRGDTFEKLTTDVPVLDRIAGEFESRCVPYVRKQAGKYQMWYTSTAYNGWIKSDDKMKPLYDVKYIESENLLDWKERGQTAVTFTNNDEYGIGCPRVWVEDNTYKMMYSIRTLSKGYRLGYAESEDGIHFKRMDESVGIDVSDTGFDSEMQCFAGRIQYKDKVYLFYSGNHYGIGGIGYAELSNE